MGVKYLCLFVSLLTHYKI